MADDYHGHATMLDGTHVALSKDDAEALWRAAKAAEERLAAQLPDTATALNAMQEARARLRDLGWRDGMFCPKNGSPFAVIFFGSTGIFEAFYMGDWPTGHVYCCDYLNHPDGMLFKLLDALTDAERAVMEKCMADDRVMRDAELNAMIQTDQAST